MKEIKIIKYDKVGEYIDLTIYCKGKILNTTIPNKNRTKEEILTDAYILLNAIGEEHTEPIKEIETYTLKEDTPTSLKVDLYNLEGEVFNQYGEKMDEPITFEIVGTDKAKIEDGKIITQEVEKETSFFIVAKSGKLTKKYEQIIYPKSEEENTLNKRISDLEIAFAEIIGG